MPIYQQGAINTNAQIVPNASIIIVPPQVAVNGVPTNILGIVGTASWGPVNSPTIASGQADTTAQFGRMQPRKYDLGTAVYAASQQGAANFRLVRVTDGTDTAATATITAANAALATAIAQAINMGVNTLRGPSQLVVASSSGSTVTLTAKYTGTTGNTLQASISQGAASSSSRLVVALPGSVQEVYDNIGATTSTVSTATFAGGTDGASTITASTLVGQDTNPRKGMYAMRGSGAAVVMLADADDSTQWTLQNAYGLSEGSYMVGTSPAGDTITNFATTLAAAGIDSYAMKILLGDWCIISDQANNGIQRAISPQGFLAGKLAALSPEQSGLNKPLFGIIGTQSSLQNKMYSDADLQALALARGDVITNPIPAGQVFGSRLGLNTSSQPGTFDDNYPRMTNFLARTLNAGMGIYIGKLQANVPNDPTRRDARATIDNYMSNLLQQNMIAGFRLILDQSNNPQPRVDLGYMQADLMVKYLAVIRYFLVNLIAGQTVTVTVSNSPTAAFQ